MRFRSTQVHALRLRRSGLVERFATPEETASHLLGVQAQLLPAAALAFWNRTKNLEQSTLEAARAKHRKLVRFWGPRNTVHLFRSADWPFLHTALDERPELARRKLEQVGLYADFRRLVQRTAKRLADGQELTYKDIRSKKLQEGQDKWVIAYAVFMELVRQGVACQAFERDNQSVFIHREHWLPRLAWSPPTKDEALPQLAERYLAAYGPAEARDLAFWYGGTVAQANSWLASAGERCQEIQVDGKSYWCRHDDLDELASRAPAASRWPVRLLYRFDPLLLATKDKSWLIDEEHYKKVWRAAAHVEPVLLVRGRIAGVWRYDRRSKGLRIELRPFAKLTPAVRRAAEAQAQAIAGFLEQPLLDFQVQTG